MKELEFSEDYLSSEGSLWLMEHQAKRACKDKLERLVNQKALISLMCDGKRYFTLPKYAMWESSVAKDIYRIHNNYYPCNVAEDVLEAFINEGEKEYGITLHEQQREAVICAIRNGICVITGGPGTGKTCTLQVMTYVLRKISYGVDIRFTAPTGKAARRISESTRCPAKTTQKELGITFTNKAPKFFGGDVLIVDEVSMLDMETAYYMFRSIISGQKVILVGDINQLPSVGPGAVLRDLLLSDVIPFVQLTKTFRQAAGSNLFENIQKIRNGEWNLMQGDDFDIVDVNADPLEQIISLFKRECDLYGIENVACLLPYRKAGVLCSDYVNNVLQNIINPVGGKDYLKSYTEKGLEIKFTEGDPVMQLVNRAECANGDVGFVKKIAKGRMYVTYCDGTKVSYTKNDIHELALAYSMSINKSQGSEYKSVVMAITMDHKAMLKRNLLYTGITRAKKKVSLLKENAAMIQSINCEEEYARTTFLAEKVRFLFGKNSYAVKED